jgi:hypothetical protein
MQAAGDLVKSFLVSQREAAGTGGSGQSQPRRRKYQKGKIADSTIMAMANG